MRYVALLICFAMAMPHLGAGEKALTVGIVVYDGVTISEVTGPLEVFSPSPLGKHSQAFEVVLISWKKQPFTSHEGMTVLPHHSFKTAPSLMCWWYPVHIMKR